MKGITWRSEHEFSLEDVVFHCSPGDYSQASDESRFILLKDRVSLESYEQVLKNESVRNMLEFGVFQGGSPAFFSLWLGLGKFVGVDICAPVEALERFSSARADGQCIRTYYGVSQNDKPRLEPILRSEFGTEPLDLVVDDASHDYGLTRRAFEIAFPYLRPGGYYVIEDWGWAHWPGSQFYKGETALSLLVMELLMLCATRSDIVSEVRVFPSFAFVRKSVEAPALENFQLSDSYNKRGLALSGSTHFDVKGLAGLLAERSARRIRRTLRRFSARKP